MKDTDLMPFGKYKGKSMQDVPAPYLHWLWQNGMKDFKVTANQDSLNVRDYIKENLNALKQKYPDGIWS